MNKKEEPQPVYLVSYVLRYSQNEWKDPVVERVFKDAAVIIYDDNGYAFLGFKDEKDRPKK